MWLPADCFLLLIFSLLIHNLHNCKCWRYCSFRHYRHCSFSCDTSSMTTAAKTFPRFKVTPISSMSHHSAYECVWVTKAVPWFAHLGLPLRQQARHNVDVLIWQRKGQIKLFCQPQQPLMQVFRVCLPNMADITMWKPSILQNIDSTHVLMKSPPQGLLFFGGGGCHQNCQWWENSLFWAGKRFYPMWVDSLSTFKASPCLAYKGTNNKLCCTCTLQGFLTLY